MGQQAAKPIPQTPGTGEYSGTRTMVLPFQALARPASTDETTVKQTPADVSDLEVETLLLNTSRSSPVSTGARRNNRYIKRYRNEEDKLVDMLKEKEILLSAAVRQGQQLRAKCNRYKDEVESLKAISTIDMTDQLWKKKYSELDKKYRDLKEELDVMVARNKNGRDFLRQQNETIAQLTMELQQEKMEKQQVMSTSLPSLQGIGVSDKKGKLAISKLKIDKQLLEERILELTQRNQRGRDYVAKLEADNKEQEAIISRLKAQLLQEKSEKEALLLTQKISSGFESSKKQIETETRIEAEVISPSSPTYARVNKVQQQEDMPAPTKHELLQPEETTYRSTVRQSHNDDLLNSVVNPIYAEVNKPQQVPDTSAAGEMDAPYTNGIHEETEVKSMGFELPDMSQSRRTDDYEDDMVVNPANRHKDITLPEDVELLQTGTEASINFEDELLDKDEENEAESPRTYNGSSSSLSSDPGQELVTPTALEKPFLEIEQEPNDKFHFEPTTNLDEECVTRF